MFVILTPALACPSLAKEGESIDVLLLARKRQIHDDLSSMTYSSWKHDKEKPIDRKDVEIVPFASSDYHISEYVTSLYAEKGFTEPVKARITISEKKGLYQLNNPFSDDISSIITALEPPSFVNDGPVMRHHPFYLGNTNYLNIGHISDSHLAARMDMLEERWNKNFNDAWHKSSLSSRKPGDFSNYNSQFEHILKALNKDKTVDLIIHTGDITDYNRGYHNKEGENDLNRDYYLDKNWLLFYTLLYENYEKPFFSVLGNHDYRLNPYSPNPVIIHRRIREFFNMAPTVNLTRSEMNTIHEDPYSLNITKNHIVKEPYAVRWYSLVINPLLDYQVFYGNMAFLMLDWNLGEDHEEGNPWGEKVISRDQWNLLSHWYKRMMNHRKRRKIIAVVVMHCSVFNPFPGMGDRKLRVEPESDVFYKSILKDHYSSEKDLLDGTFRLKRNEFIARCLGNMSYVKSHEIRPERGIDLILTGHAHRSGFFQVEGLNVYLRRPDSLKEGPVFCNAISSGPIGIKNEEGGAECIQLDPPGYHVISVRNGISIDVYHSDLVSIREDARCSHGEVARGEFFEVLDTVVDLPLFDPEYSWQITNLREGTTITRITIITGLTSPITVKKVPLGWGYAVRKVDGFTHVICEAHDRGQGIFFEESGDVTIHVEGKSSERIGVLTAAWDMTDDASPPVKVRVPSD